MPLGGAPQDGRVRVRFRGAGGELADTTLDRVSVDDVVAGWPVRGFPLPAWRDPLRGRFSDGRDTQEVR